LDTFVEAVMTEGNGSKGQAERLRQLFGNYKAEWLRDKMFELFTEPAYFPDLRDARPCVLEGGRGTGKTTVLRALSYEGRFALEGRSAKAVAEWDYVGLYHRVNTNRVTAFKGPEVTEAQWIRHFAHYFNLELVDLVLGFLDWYHNVCPDHPQLGRDAVEDVAGSLHLVSCTSTSELAHATRRAKRLFEAYINNIADQGGPPLSLQGAPVDALVEAVAELPQFRGLTFFFLLDEYENLEDYQQQVVNTLVKHASQGYVFKIGVRELGWRRRTTLNSNEQLISPADYARINITERLEGKFPQFAAAVCRVRLAQVYAQAGLAQWSVEDILPGLPESEEAVLLGVESRRREIINRHSGLDHATSDWLESLAPLEVVYADSVASSSDKSMEELRDSYEREPTKWRTNFGNYSHALLFTINRGRRGIRKYYSGWDVFTKLSARNIRYLLELLDVSMMLHFDGGGMLDQPLSPEVQTKGAQAVGKKNLAELEGLSVHGARLTKLLLGLGRIFGVMAAQPIGHAPEVNQFALGNGGGGDGRTDDALELLRAAVMHLALLRFPGSKLQDPSDTKAYDYSVHPIYAPYFEFSHRRKRKMILALGDLVALVEEPRQAIERILAAQNRANPEPLPDQLKLFEGYYVAAS
jgi:hypothetical protein